MDALIDLAKSALHVQVELWEIVAAALVPAWVEQRAHRRGREEYDAWWMHNIPASTIRRELRAHRRGPAGRREAEAAEALRRVGGRAH